MPAIQTDFTASDLGVALVSRPRVPPPQGVKMTFTIKGKGKAHGRQNPY